MTDLREEVLLGQPEVRKAGALCRHDVVEVLRVDPSLGVRGPWLRHLELAHQSELHVVSILSVVRRAEAGDGAPAVRSAYLIARRNSDARAPRRKSLVSPRDGNYSERRAAFDFGRAPPHEDVGATGPPHESSHQTRFPGQTRTMIAPRWRWWLADRRRCDVKRALTLRPPAPGLLPAPEKLGADFPSFRPTIGEPDTPAWQELRAASVEDALISLGVPGYLRPQEALKLYEISYHAPGDALELGSAWGLSTMILARAKRDAKRPGRVVSVEILPDHHWATHENLQRHGLRDRVTLLLGDADEVLPWLVGRRRRFAFAFIDHDHGFAASRHAVEALRKLVVPGGLALFHDMNDARHETGE